ncbi:cytolysin (calcineurin-like family phosphatase) [Parabacteroides sp. PFB2-10]|uniref:metallophosphoesterase n=1 Tax=Parabacteroides sp. PFB2-10 TaxID=1742405 RepID=UPI002473CC7D|nr:metallophosphoesterase [Parabacteroides sp. PFB2-10]MDH6311327.1 cytolysin (calcineurin-like family phosphatase) [Parabacteroides sp. PFB2-10]
MSRISNCLICIAFLLTGLFTSCSDSVTFIVVSDPHFKGDDTTRMVNHMMVEDMNSLKGTIAPWNNKALKPAFVWMLGDMTDNGEQEQWDDYENTYGLNGEKLLQYPVMECFGNHDGNVDGLVRAALKERNKNRKTKITTDSLGLHYSWDQGNIHFVNLNLYPGDDWDPACAWCHYFKESFREPQHSLAFLKKDLKEKVGRSGRPVVLGFHIGFDDFSQLWWTDADREKLYEVIKEYNIIAIFQGHNHAAAPYTWKGIDIWAVGSPRHDDKTGEYMVVEIDAKGNYCIHERHYGEWE